MSSIRWLPFFVFGGLGLGQAMGGRLKAGCIFLSLSFLAGIINRFIDIWSQHD